MSQTYNCAVCGKPVDPAVDVVMTAGPKPVFVVHADKCRDTVRVGVEAARDLVEARWPKMRTFRETVVALAKALNK